MGSSGSPNTCGGTSASGDQTAVVIGDVLVAGDSPFVELDQSVDLVLASSLSPASGEDAAGF